MLVSLEIQAVRGEKWKAIQFLFFYSLSRGQLVSPECCPGLGSWLWGCWFRLSGWSGLSLLSQQLCSFFLVSLLSVHLPPLSFSFKRSHSRIFVTVIEACFWCSKFDLLSPILLLFAFVCNLNLLMCHWLLIWIYLPFLLSWCTPFHIDYHSMLKDWILLKLNSHILTSLDCYVPPFLFSHD